MNFGQIQSMRLNGAEIKEARLNGSPLFTDKYLYLDKQTVWLIDTADADLVGVFSNVVWNTEIIDQENNILYNTDINQENYGKTSMADA